jgi:hypothetical protein
MIAIGLDYKVKNFSALIAPLSGKITTVNDQRLADAGAFGVDPAQFDAAGNMTSRGDRVRKEFGGFIKIMYRKDLMTNVTFQTKADFFSNYLENPENIDINWESVLSMKINKFLVTTVTFSLIYDDDVMISVDDNHDGVVEAIGPRTQFKEVLAIGLSYKF